MTLSRRDLLRCAGAAAGTALFSCGGGARALLASQPDDDEIALALQEALAELARWPSARALARRHLHAAAASDVLGGGAMLRQRAGAVFAITGTGGEVLERATSVLDAASLVATARALATEASARRLVSAPADAAPHAQPQSGALAPKLWSAALMQAHVAALAQRTDAVSSSRIIYRSAGVDVDATTSWYGAASTVARRAQMRQRSAIAIVASGGEAPRGQELAFGHTLSPDASSLVDDLTEAELALAVERLLLLTTPEPLSTLTTEVLLDASVVAAMMSALARSWHTCAPSARRAFANALAAAPWSAVVAPTSPGAYGGYALDDLGHAAREHPLFSDDRGETWAPGSFLRQGLIGAPSREPRHLRLEAPRSDDLATKIERGYLIEEATEAFVDLEGDELVVHAHLARELRGGAATGRAYPTVSVRLRPSELARALVAFGATAESRCARIESRDGPSFSSMELPAIVAVAELAQRRPR